MSLVTAVVLFQTQDVKAEISLAWSVHYSLSLGIFIYLQQ